MARIQEESSKLTTNFQEESERFRKKMEDMEAKAKLEVERVEQKHKDDMEDIRQQRETDAEGAAAREAQLLKAIAEAKRRPGFWESLGRAVVTVATAGIVRLD